MGKWKSDALIVEAVRSPIGRRNRTLSTVRGDELAGQVLNALVERVGLEPGEIEDVQMGCVTQIGEQGWNVGRMAVLVAGGQRRSAARPSTGSAVLDADELQRGGGRLVRASTSSSPQGWR